jgi:hypothetical protein
VHDAIEELKPAYAEVIREVELKGRSLVDVAGEKRITPKNAGVRLQLEPPYEWACSLDAQPHISPPAFARCSAEPM